MELKFPIDTYHTVLVMGESEQIASLRELLQEAEAAV